MTEYIVQLLKNLPPQLCNPRAPLLLDIILDGGAFNGSYLVGALKFIKEMEHRKWVRVRRISGVSIGAVCGMLYFADQLDAFFDLYKVMSSHLRQSHNLDIMDYATKFLTEIWENSKKPLPNNRLFLSYWNVDKGEKRVVKHYQSIAHMVTCLNRSCFVPFIINGNLSLDEKYIDGINPFMLSTSSSSKNGIHPINPNPTKTLYINLCAADKYKLMWNIKNEMTNHQRVLAGILDVHAFFIKGAATPMCSYVNDWSPAEYAYIRVRHGIELLAIYIIRLFVIAYKSGIGSGSGVSSILSTLPAPFVRFLRIIWREIGVMFVELYCLC